MTHTRTARHAHTRRWGIVVWNERGVHDGAEGTTYEGKTPRHENNSCPAAFVVLAVIMTVFLLFCLLRVQLVEASGRAVVFDEMELGWFPALTML